MDEQGLTQKQKNERYDYSMTHLNEGLEDSEELKDKCDALNKKLDEMYDANHKAGDKFLDQRKHQWFEAIIMAALEANDPDCPYLTDSDEGEDMTALDLG